TSTLFFGNANLPIPSQEPGSPENMIAPYWADMTIARNSAIRAYGDPAHFVVSWNNMTRVGSRAPGSVEVILYPDGRILFEYGGITGLNHGTSGIQNSTRTDGLSISYNDSRVRDDMAV